VKNSGASPWPIASWLMVGFVAIAGLVGVFGDALSPTLVLDLVALWPVILLSVLAGVLAFWRRRENPRLLALPPLIMLSWMLVGTGLHLGGWDALPSAAAVVRAEMADVNQGVLTVSIRNGTLALGASEDGVLYELAPLNRGGQSPVPEVTTILEDGAARVSVAEGDPDFWFRFAGWQAQLSDTVPWTIEAGGTDIHADLSRLKITSARFVGAGEVILGGDQVELQLSGTFLVTVPSGASVAVLGSAVVPGDWEQTADGWESPQGRGTVITVPEGASVEIRTR